MLDEKNVEKLKLIFYALYLAMIIYIIFSWRQTASFNGPTGLISLGGLLGLIGGLLLLIQMILTSGAWWIEKVFALDRLTRIHRIHGYVAFFVIISHPLFITTGYAQLSDKGFKHQYIEFLQSFEGVLLAAIAYYLLILIVVLSAFRIRRYLKFEIWYYFHQLTYLIILLPLFHQLALGQTLSGETFRMFWIAIYVFAFGNSIFFKWLYPLYTYERRRFRVERIEREASNTISIYVSGNNLNDFKYDAGQFAFWYFWQKGLRLQKHPFTISSSPGDDLLRLTPKAVGDYTKKLSELRPGTKVFLDGPYGRFSSKAQLKQKRLFIAGGIGVTPIKSILGATLQSDDILIYAARSSDEIAFRGEWNTLIGQGLSVQYVYSEVKSEDAQEGYIDKDKLAQIADLSERDVYLCGPPPMMKVIEQALNELEIPKAQIHTEKFSLI